MFLKINYFFNVFIVDLLILIFWEDNLNMQIFHQQYPEAAVHRCSTRKILKDVVKIKGIHLCLSLFLVKLLAYSHFRGLKQNDRSLNSKVLKHLNRDCTDNYIFQYCNKPIKMRQKSFNHMKYFKSIPSCAMFDKNLLTTQLMCLVTKVAIRSKRSIRKPKYISTLKRSNRVQQNSTII